MKLELEQKTYYRLKKGQSLADVASAYGVPPRVLAALNGLKEEPREGSVLQIPAERRNLYMKISRSGTGRNYSTSDRPCGCDLKSGRDLSRKRAKPLRERRKRLFLCRPRERSSRGRHKGFMKIFLRNLAFCSLNMLN